MGRFGAWLTASCSSLDSWSCVRCSRVRWTVQAGHTERGTGGGRMLEATPSAGFREASVECAGGVEGVVGMMRASAGPAATSSSMPQGPRAHSALALRRPGLAGTLPLFLSSVLTSWSWRRRFGCWIFSPIVLWLYRNYWHTLWCQARLEGIIDADEAYSQ